MRVEPPGAARAESRSRAVAAWRLSGAGRHLKGGIDRLLCHLQSQAESAHESNRHDHIIREAASDEESSLASRGQAAVVRRVRGIPASLSTAAGTPASRQAL